MIQVEILYVDNCPNYTKACSTICDIIAELDLDANIAITKVRPEQAEGTNRFRGSPTVLVNGTDVEMCFNEMNQIDNTTELVNTIACRLYNCNNGRGCPSHEMVRCTVETVVETS